MTTVFGPSPVSIKAGTQTWGPATVPDGLTGRITVTLAHWTGPQTLSANVEMSFDGGATWPYAVAVPTMGSPTGIWKGILDLIISFPAMTLCSCGELYAPGLQGNDRVLAHSDHFGVPSSVIAAMPDLSGITFHNPDSQPAPAVPQRLARLTTVASGNISSTLTVDAT